MLYFAYGSNLNHFQMKRRCKDSVFLKKINLSDFKLTFRSKYRAADIDHKKNSIVPGALFEISKSDEKKLDVYEDYCHKQNKAFNYLITILILFFFTNSKISELHLSILDLSSERITIETPNLPA